MANKFQKSVQARTELGVQKNTDKGKREKPTLTTDRYAEMKPIASTVTPSPELLMDIVLRPSRRAKNKTLYLDEAVIEAIRQQAKSLGVTDSALVNEMLRRVFGL